VVVGAAGGFEPLSGTTTAGRDVSTSGVSTSLDDGLDSAMVVVAEVDVAIDVVEELPAPPTSGTSIWSEAVRSSLEPRLPRPIAKAVPANSRHNPAAAVVATRRRRRIEPTRRSTSS